MDASIEEAPPSADRRVSGARLGAEAAAGFSYRDHTGRIAPGSGYGGAFEPWGGPERLSDRSAGTLDARYHLVLPSRVALGGDLLLDHAGELRVREFYGTGRVGPVAFWGGRRRLGFGPGRSGGVVLDPSVTADGAGFFLMRPVGLPSVLSVLGPFHLDMTLSRGDRNGVVEQPWLWATRVSFSPHSRLSIGIQRGLMLDAEGADLEPSDYLSLLFGQHLGGRSGFENAVASIDVWYLPPIDRIPLAAYLEWGFEDSSGAWKNVPGIVAGVQVAAFPGLPQLSFGFEGAYFAAACCGNPIWYRHIRFQDGWSWDGEPMSHPLGGHGTEWSIYGSADFAASRVRTRGRVFLRDRGEENRFAPLREDGSSGVDLTALVRVRPSLDTEARLRWESGERDWSEFRASIGLSRYFH